MRIIKTYKSRRRIVCYITERNGVFKVCTGKPSDAECISWSYNNLPDAFVTASEYFANYSNI